MNIVEAKAQLKLKGYCQFNLQDLNKNLYDTLKESFMCNSEKNFKENFTQLRSDYKVDSKAINIQNTYESHQIANEAVDSILQKYNNEEITNLMQIWYHSSIHQLYDTNGTVFKTQGEYLQFIHNMCNEVVYSMFAHHKDEELDHLIDFTYYDVGCRLDTHSDGSGTGRICACLIYLNESYDESDGGYLVLDNEETVLPIFGNVAIIDLEKFDVPHGVTEVTGGIGRYALLSFCKKKGNKFE